MIGRDSSESKRKEIHVFKVDEIELDILRYSDTLSSFSTIRPKFFTQDIQRAPSYSY